MGGGGRLAPQAQLTRLSPFFSVQNFRPKTSIGLGNIGPRQSLLNQGNAQQLVIQIVNLEEKLTGEVSVANPNQLPEWCNVYAGLSDEQIATLEKAISRWLDLSRAGN